MFTIRNIDLAFLKFTLMSTDAFGESQTLAVACYPINGLRSGVRSIPLQNLYMERIPHAALLVNALLTDDKEKVAAAVQKKPSTN